MAERGRSSRAHRVLRGLDAALASWRARVALRRADRLGARPWVSGRPFLRNLGTMTLGDDIRLSSRPAPSHLVTGPGATLACGDRVTIGHGAAITAASAIAIGDECWIGPGAVVIDTDFHRAGDPDSAASAPITIGPRVRLGERVTVLKGSTIGEGAWVAAGSVVSGPVAAGARVSGAPARPVGPRGPGAAGPADVEAAVVDVARRAFAAEDLGPDTRVADIPGWDSFAALRLLLALEDALGCVLPEEAVYAARSLREMAGIAARSREGHV